jgi:hypothetical protein
MELVVNDGYVTCNPGMVAIRLSLRSRFSFGANLPSCLPEIPVHRSPLGWLFWRVNVKSIVLSLKTNTINYFCEFYFTVNKPNDLMNFQI